MAAVENIKLNLIKEILNTEDTQKLEEIHDSLQKTVDNEGKTRETFSDFLKLFSESDVQNMKMAIEETCEKINPDEWKGDLY